MEINTNMHLNITNVKRSFGMSNTHPASDCFFLYTSVLFSVSCFFIRHGGLNLVGYIYRVLYTGRLYLIVDI